MGVFGSTTGRFLWNQNPESLDPDDQTPGPGTYTQDTNVEPVPPTGVRRPMVHTSSAFRSTSSRFGKNNNHAPEFHIVGECPNAAVGDYNISSDEKHHIATNPYLNIPFMSQVQRSGITPINVAVPGPGHYESSQVEDNFTLGSFTRSNLVRSTIGLQPRFKTKVRHHELLGPGSYQVGNTMGKKSFNVTMKLKSSSNNLK